jgi:hypothetical protein
MSIGSSINSALSGVTDALGLTNVESTKKAYDKAQSMLQDTLAQSGQTYSQILESIKGTGRSLQDQLGGSASVSDWINSIKEAGNKDYSVDSSKVSDFDWGKIVSDYLDPNASYMIDQATQAAQNTLAGQGGLFSGGAGQQLQAVASDKARELYGDAQEQMNKEKSFDYNKLLDELNIDVGNVNREQNQDAAYSSNLGNIASAYQTAVSDTQEGVSNALLSKLQNDSSIQQTLANMGISEASATTFLGSILGDVIGVYSAVKGGGGKDD